MQTLVGETLGIEFETDNVPQDRGPFRRGSKEEEDISKYWRETRDASIETDRFYFKGLYIGNIQSKLNNLFNLSKVVTGVEFVSNIMDYNNTKEIETALNVLLEYLRGIGEPLTSERSGIHFHISTPYNLRILKSIIRLGCYLEDFFFYFGSFGYTPRGNKNNHIYCRPITQYGPVVVPINSSQGHQVFNIKDLLDSKTAQEFWYKYFGVTIDPNYGSGGPAGDHYSPVRYHWLNLLSLIQKGSLEFRIFNKILNKEYIMAALEICIKFVELVMISSFDTLKADELLSKNSIYLNRSKEDIIETFLNFAERVKLSEKTVNITKKIIEDTPKVKIDNCYYFTHKRGYSTPYNWSERKSIYLPSTIPLEIVKKPTYVDIHVLRGEEEGGSRREDRIRLTPRVPEELRRRPESPTPTVQFSSDSPWLGARLETETIETLTSSTSTRTNSTNE